MSFEAVLFDLDGVLVEACDWHYEALNCALIDTLGFTISRDEHLAKYNGLPTSVKLQMLGVDAILSRHINELKQQYTIQIIETRANLSPEKIELLEYLKSTNIKVACVTNSIPETARLMLERTGQLGYMDLLVTNKDVVRNKPYPDCYNYAVKALGVNPLHTLCVEDSPKGIQAAESSEVEHLWVVTGSNDVTLNNYQGLIS